MIRKEGSKGHLVISHGFGTPSVPGVCAGCVDRPYWGGEDGEGAGLGAAEGADSAG